MKILTQLTKSEISLLLFFETRAVDHSGKVNTVHMNKDDQRTVETWNTKGFVRYGRICSDGLSEHGTHWCQLSENAWALAAEARRARAARGWANRSWLTTEEKRTPTAEAAQ